MALGFLPTQAFAGAFELGVSFSFNRSKYTETSHSFTRRWAANFGYHFNERSEIEAAIQDSVDRTKITGYEDTTFHDRIYSLNWVQGFLPRTFPIQPTVKIGIGQLNRDASGTYFTGTSPPAQVDSITAVMGAGIRWYLTRTFSIRTEVTTYLVGGKLSTYRDNVAFMLGTSIYF